MNIKNFSSFKTFTGVLASLLMNVMLSSSVMADSTQSPKREFRGAWLHVIGQSQWMKKTPQQQKEYIIDQLDKLEADGCNAVIFQIRPHADALYKSDIEPWSSWLTGKRGKAPSEDWDPLEFIVNAAHERGMELHAWMNPYRVTSSPETLPADHISNKYPDRFVKFGGKTFFDPAYRENQEYIANIVKDVITRYDVDAIHFDDYFYPYPTEGAKFNADGKSYAKFGNGMDKGDWRRKNVDNLIELVSTTIKETKPWVRFGISPFGIWRNKKSDPRGSDTNGLQNYDDLYADVILWAEKGWIDYLAPQLYWSLDHKVASTRKLAQWWNDHTPENCDLYIGYDVRQTMSTPAGGKQNELSQKVDLSRSLPNVDGNIWWHGYWVTENFKGAGDELRNNLQKYLALAPAYGDKNKRPAEVKNIKVSEKDGKSLITWDLPADFGGYNSKPKDLKNQKDTDPVKFVVYEFLPDEEIDLNDASGIITVTPKNEVLFSTPEPGTTILITSVDRMNRESKPVKYVIK